jgi:hypothetical protein
VREMRVVETGLCLGIRIRFYPVGLNLCSLFYSLPNDYFHVSDSRPLSCPTSSYYQLIFLAQTISFGCFLFSKRRFLFSQKKKKKVFD